MRIESLHFKLHKLTFTPINVLSISLRVLLFLSTLQLGSSIYAQCTSSPNGQYPTSTVAITVATSCTSQTITTLAYTGEYSVLSGAGAQTYVFLSSVTTDFITIVSDDLSTTYGFGVTPLSVTFSAAPGNIRFYRHDNAACGFSSVSRTVSVQCSSCPAPAAPSCTTNSSPANMAVDISLTPTLSWAAATGADSYQIWLGTSVAGAVNIGSVTGTAATLTSGAGLTNSTTYYWYVVPENTCAGTSASGCSANATSFTTVGSPPANDNCSGATAFGTIPTDGTCATLSNQSTLAATNSNVTPTGSCTTNSGTPDDDVWFSFVAPGPSVALEATYVSGLTDVYWQVFSSTCGSSMTSILCTDTNSGGTLTGLTTGNTYYIRLYTWASSGSSVQNICLKTPPNMSYISSTTTQGPTTAVTAGSTNQQILRLDVTVINTGNPLKVSEIVFNTTGTTDLTALSNAKVFYTGTSTTFSTTTAFGTAIPNPNGTLTFTNSTGQTLTGGTANTVNYFWLAYDINPCFTTASQSVDGQSVSFTFLAGSPNTPTVTNPTGSRSVTPSTGTSFTSVVDGSWSSAATWGGCTPDLSAATTITINSNVTLDGSFNYPNASLTINSGKTLTIPSGSLTFGPTNGGNKLITVNGTLTLSGGTLEQNGSLTFASTSTFNMASGTLNIDPNSGVSGTSATTAALLLNGGVINVTGGAINIKDPNFSAAAGAASRAIAYSSGTADASFGTGCTVTLGTTTGGNHSNAGANGFYIECNVSTGTLNIGTLIVDGGSYAATNSRHMTTHTSAGFITSVKNLTVNSGSEVVVRAAPLAITGDVVNNGIISVITTGVDVGLVFCGDAQYSSGVVFSNSANAQSLSGSGYFRKAVSDAVPGSQSGNLCGSFSIWQTATGAGVTLNMPLTVTSSLRLNDGKIITSASNLLTLGTSGSLLGTLYTNSTTAPTNIQNANVGGWVNGPFKRWFTGTTTDLSQQGILPIGSGTKPHYTQIVFTTTVGTGGTLTSFFTSGIPGDTGLPLTDATGTNPYCNTGAVNATGYVTLTSGDGLGAGNYTSRFNVTNYSLAPFLSDIPTVRVLKRPTGGGAWTLDGTFVAGANNITSRTGMSGFSEFAQVQGALAPLPLELISFSGRAEKTVNVLDWTTASEINTDKFVVEKSQDGIRWEYLTDVKAGGFSTLEKAYTTTDHKPYSLTYYRLKMMDLDGKYEYSEVVKIERTSKRSDDFVRVYPVPTFGKVMVQLEIDQVSEVSLTVTDIVGRLLFTGKQSLQEGLNEIPLDLTGFTPGTYFLKVDNGVKQYTQRIIKE